MTRIKKQYKNLSQDEIDTVWHIAAKHAHYGSIAGLIETDRITPEMIEYGINRACLYDDIKLFKILLKSKSFIPEHWSKSLVTSAGGGDIKILTMVLKKYQFTPKEIEAAFYNSKNSIAVFKMLLPYVDIGTELKKDDFAFLKDLVNKSQITVAQLLIQEHNIDLIPFKDLAREKQSQYNGDKMLKMIENQELFNNLNEALDNKNSKKSKKI